MTDFIIAIVSIALVVLLYVFIISEIKRINREKITKQEILKDKKNRVEMYSVEIQKLSTESRIEKIAQDSLGLIKPKNNIEILQVPKNQIDQIEKLIKEKYD